MTADGLQRPVVQTRSAEDLCFGGEKAASGGALRGARRRTATARVTWQQVAHESGVSAQTIQRTKGQAQFEVDGILALTGWLGRPIEESAVGDGIGQPVKREEQR